MEEMCNVVSEGKGKLRERYLSAMDDIANKIKTLTEEVIPFLEESANHYTYIERDMASCANIIRKLYGVQRSALNEEMQRVLVKFSDAYEQIVTYDSKNVPTSLGLNDAVLRTISQINVYKREKDRICGPFKLRRFLEEEPTVVVVTPDQPSAAVRFLNRIVGYVNPFGRKK